MRLRGRWGVREGRREGGRKGGREGGREGRGDGGLEGIGADGSERRKGREGRKMEHSRK
jgi:hypothetical protein